MMSDASRFLSSDCKSERIPIVTLSKLMSSAAFGEYVTGVGIATCGAAGVAGFELVGVWRDGFREFMYLGVSNDVSEAVPLTPNTPLGSSFDGMPANRITTNLLAHRLNNHPFGALTVPFAIKDPLPGPEVERPIRDR